MTRARALRRDVAATFATTSRRDISATYHTATSQVLHVLNHNYFTLFIILLVLFGMVYDMVISLALGITVQLIEKIQFYIMYACSTSASSRHATSHV